MMTYAEKQSGVHSYAAGFAASAARDGGDHKVYAGASSAMMAGRCSYTSAHEMAWRAINWCDVRGIEYADVREAVGEYTQGAAIRFTESNE